ncbi:MAG TPA: ABC transporter substrate-binding protein [Candidatus Acidoferrales bacterium]|nr:ABC transporter substrate-binding protein [Candidatus Acidoferrales bacterium]
MQRLRYFVHSFAIAALVATNATGARSQELQTVKVGVISSMSMAPFYIADRLGYFKDEGLNVQFTQFDSVTNMVAPLGVGQLDVGGGALAAGIYNAVARGIDVKVVADLASDPPGYGFQQLLVRSELVKSGKFKTIKDLKGLTIAGNTPGSTSSSELNQLLKKAGLKFDDVKRVFMGYPDHVIGLRNGSVDASLMPEPNATAAEKTGAAVKFTGDDTFYPNQQIAVVVYGVNMLKAHRDVGMKFMRAFIKAARFYNGALAEGKLTGANADQVVTIMTQETKIKDPAVYRAVTPNGINPDGHVLFPSMHTDFDFFKSQGLIEGNVRVEDVVDDSFAAQAIRQLGPYKAKKA